MTVLPPNRPVRNRTVTPFDGTAHYGCVSKVGGNVRCMKPLYELGETGYVGASEWSTFVSTTSPDRVAHYIKCELALAELTADEMPQTESAMRAFVNSVA